MANSHEDRVVALAGVAQAAQLVSQAAHTGMIAQDSLEATLKTLFVFDPPSTLAVFDNPEHLKAGLRLLAGLLAGRGLRESGDVLQYVLAMTGMARKLAQNSAIPARLGEELRNIAADGDALGDNEIHRIALVYEQTIGKLEPRIKVVGNRHHLRNEVNVERIRSLLLAGIRAAVLWRQVGGRRWQLLVSRGRMKQALSRVAENQQLL